MRRWQKLRAGDIVVTSSPDAGDPNLNFWEVAVGVNGPCDVCENEIDGAELGMFELAQEEAEEPTVHVDCWFTGVSDPIIWWVAQRAD